jgi:hypothetical protein
MGDLLRPFGSQILLSYLAFQRFDFERILLRLFQKRVQRALN